MVSSIIGLEGQIIFTLGRVQAQIKPEALVSGRDDGSNLVSVPVVLYKGDERKEGNLLYAVDKQIFLSSLTTFFPEAEADSELTRSVMMHVAGKYAAMLELGHVKVRETEYGISGKMLQRAVYETYHDYVVKLQQRQLDELKKRNPRNKQSP